jgi:dienelactone hydrolase
MSTPSNSFTDMTEGETAVCLQPSPWLIALHGFAKGVTVAAIVVSALMGLEVSLGVPRVISAAVMGFLGFAILFAGEGLAVLLWKVLGLLCRLLHFAWGTRTLQTVPPVPVGRIFGAFVYIAGDMLWPNSFFQSIILPVAGELAIVLTGFAVMMVALAWMNGRSRPAQIALIGVPALLILAFAVWVFNPGFDGYVAALPETAPSLALALENPGQPGPYTVQTLSYGSGVDGRRPEYGADASLITPAVDGSRIFSGYGNLVSAYFHWYWGFDFSQLPLNGLVWYPESAGPHSEGPFPLVLIVHGNHAMSDYSEPGYAYLGEHLASQGYIAVTVDENFLNGLLFFDGEFEEMPLRAWLLLQHLRQWRSWNETPGNLFYGKADLERVALIGHSRGGEAVAWAEHFNRRPMERVTAVSPASDFGFGIRGVVAIAPSDAYAEPGSRHPTLDQSSYLLLAGGHDADTFILYGQRQYNRAQLQANPNGFKALAYLHQANHGQFNSVWGNKDRSLYNSLLLNRAPLLTAAEQEQAAKVMITSFLNASLRDEAGYRAVFGNPATGVNWLPPGIVATQLQEASFIPVDTNSGGAALAATEVTGAEAAAQDMTVAQVETLKLRDGQTDQGNKALHLVWDAGSQPSYAITLPQEKAADWGLSPEYSLTFALAGVPGEPAGGDVWVELATVVGQTARLPISDFGPILPTLPAYLVKANWLAGLNGFPGDVRPEEVVLQTYTLPLRAFQMANPAFRPDQLTAIRFLFAGDTAGALYLDGIGFSPQPGR